MKRIKLSLILELLLVLWLLPLPALAQNTTGINIVDESVETRFRDHITFSANIESVSPIEDVSLLYQVASTGLTVTSRGEADFEPGTQVSASFEVDQEQDYLPPGSEITYWWKITDQAGTVLETEPQTFTYLDERYDWKSLSNERLALYWYQGNEAFGQAIFDRANETLDQIETEAGVKVEFPVKVFLYATHDDLMSAIDVGAQEWTGGLAFTERGVVVLGVGPSDLDFALVAMPHELTHLVIHQATDNPYGDLPTWLDEGLAVYMSGELDVDWRGYRDLVLQQAKRGKLISLQTLSSSFPANSDEARQSYAQSGMVVEYIIDHYGANAMSNLLDIFSQGATYDDALEEALGVDTWQLDNEWRASIGAGTVGGSVSETTPAASNEAPATGATASAPDEQKPIEQPQVETGGGQSGGSFTLPCLGSSLVTLIVLALFWSRRSG